MKKLFLILVVLALIACKPNGPKDEVSTEAPLSKPAFADSLHAPMDTTVKTPEPAEAKEVTSTPHITDHICSPNFTLLAKPKKNHQIYYVSGFDPTEFKCWEEIINHANKVSNNQAASIYYLDNANVTVSSTPPDYIDMSTLTKNGVAKFVNNGKYWTLDGSRIWKRQGKGYDYFNTNNQAGG